MKANTKDQCVPASLGVVLAVLMVLAVCAMGAAIATAG